MRKLSEVTAKAVTDVEAIGDKPKVQAGVDTDGQVFQITLPLRVKEADLTVSEGKNAKGEVYDKASVCFKFQAKNLTLAVQMEDGTVRYYRVKNSAGPYGADRYLSLGFDPSKYMSTPPDTDDIDGEVGATA